MTAIGRGQRELIIGDRQNDVDDRHDPESGGKVVIRNSVDALVDFNQKKAGERENWTTSLGTMVVTADMVTILARNIRPTGPRSSQ